MNTAMMPAVLTGNKEALQAVREMDEEVDVLYKHLVNYLAEVSKLQLNEYQTQKIMKRAAPCPVIMIQSTGGTYGDRL